MVARSASTLLVLAFAAIGEGQMLRGTFSGSWVPKFHRGMHQEFHKVHSEMIQEGGMIREKVTEMDCVDGNCVQRVKLGQPEVSDGHGHGHLMGMGMGMGMGEGMPCFLRDMMQRLRSGLLWRPEEEPPMAGMRMPEGPPMPPAPWHVRIIFPGSRDGELPSMPELQVEPPMAISKSELQFLRPQPRMEGDAPPVVDYTPSHPVVPKAPAPPPPTADLIKLPLAFLGLGLITFLAAIVASASFKCLRPECREVRQERQVRLTNLARPLAPVMEERPEDLEEEPTAKAPEPVVLVPERAVAVPAAGTNVVAAYLVRVYARTVA